MLKCQNMKFNITVDYVFNNAGASTGITLNIPSISQNLNKLFEYHYNAIYNIYTAAGTKIFQCCNYDHKENLCNYRG